MTIANYKTEILVTIVLKIGLPNKISSHIKCCHYSLTSNCMIRLLMRIPSNKEFKIESIRQAKYIIL